MNPEQEEFSELRRLLALKRHEQPPPGYFQNFSYQVIARIKAGETAEESSFIERFFGEADWMRRIWTAFEVRPVFAGAISCAFCALLAAGLYYSDAPGIHGASTVGAMSLIAGGIGAHEAAPIDPSRPLDFGTNFPVLPAHLRQNPLIPASPEPSFQYLLFRP